MAGVIWTPLPPIPGHGYNININHSSSYDYGEEPDEVEVLKAVFDAFATFLHERRSIRRSRFGRTTWFE